MPIEDRPTNATLTDAPAGRPDQDHVLTPVGWRPRSAVHAVAPGSMLAVVDGQLSTLDEDGGVLVSLGPVPEPSADADADVSRGLVSPDPIVPATGNGWITFASWSNTTGTPISRFTTIWEVPPEPAIDRGQTIFLFNAMVNSLNMIYQPVLQWGPSAAGGGPFWSVATWYAGPPEGTTVHTATAVKVNPGDALIGVISLVDQTGDRFSYEAGFFGIADSGWAIQAQPELTALYETLETYGVEQPIDYPPVRRTTMAGIDIQQGAGRPALTWTVNDLVTDNGQHTVVHDDSADDGSIDLCYRAAPRLDDVVLWNNGKAYMFHGDGYIRYDVAADRMDPGYPGLIAPNWRGLADRFFASDLDAVVLWTNGKAYFFKGNQYCRYDVAADMADPGYPARIAGNWPGFPPSFAASIDCGTVWPNGKAYFFKDDQYIRYDVASDRTDAGYPASIAGNWPGLPSSFASGVDAVVVWDNAKAYFFRDHEYCRYDIASDRMDPGYPAPIAGNWGDLPADYV
jgi:hypothetical protein